MEIQEIKVESRRAAGTRAARRLRRTGKLPAILYGHKLDPVSLTLDRHEVERQIGQGAHLLNLKLEGKEQACLIKDVQYDHLGSTPLHLDLTRVDLTERVKVQVPLEFRGTPQGVSESGGSFMQELGQIEVECLVSDIPEIIRVEVGELALDQVLHAKDLVLPEGVSSAADPEAVIAMVRMPAAKLAEAAEPTETPAAEGEPEVIAKGKGDEEAGETEK